ESQSTLPCTGMRSPTRPCTTGASVSMKKPGTIPATRQSAAKKNIAASESRSVSRARSAAGVRARPRKVTPNAFDEAGRGQRRRERKQRPHCRHQELEAPGGQLWAQQNRLERQPFGDEAVDRRQRRDRRAADEKSESRLRHAMDEAPEVLHVALPAAGQHRPGAEEQQALEDRMI